MNKHLNNVVRGAIHGLAAWLVYETVEVVLACVFPMILWEKMVSPGDWRMLAVLFAAWPVIGLLLGGLAGLTIGLIRPGMDEFHYRASAALTLVLFGVVHLIVDTRLTGSEEIATCVGVLTAGALVAAIFSDGWRRRAGFLSSPWTVSLLLLLAPWVSEELGLSSPRVKAALSLTAVAAVAIAGALLYHKFPPRRGAGGSLPVTLAALLVAFGAAWLLSSRHSPRAAEADIRASQGKPNVLLIVMDTVRADHLSLYGYDRDTTPGFRKLAQGATVYTRAIAASDMTLTSHASMFTGLYPSWHHAVWAPPVFPLGRPLNEKFTTLAEILRNRGYATSAVVANSGYLSTEFRLNKGFTEYDFASPVVVTNWTRDFYLRGSVERFLPRVRESEKPSAMAGNISSRARRSLSRTSGKPFFLFLNYMDAHDPYLPPAPFDTLFPGKDDSLRPGWLRELTLQVEQHARPLPDAVRRHLISQYDGGIAYMDSEITKLVAELKQRGVYDNTMIIVTSDHGEALGDHGLLRHGEDSVYQDQIHIPLLIKYPGQRDGQTSDMLASHVDLMPTILEVLGYPRTAGLQGRSLLHEPPPNWVVYSEAYSPVAPAAAVPARLKAIRRAVFFGPLKLIASTSGPPELYDLSSDPHETRKLSASENPLYGALRLQFASWMKSMPLQMRDVKQGGPKNLDSLRSLGYVQ